MNFKNYDSRKPKNLISGEYWMLAPIIFLLAIVIIAICLFHFYKPVAEASISKKIGETAGAPKGNVCVDNTNQTCKSGECDGIKICKNSQWSECYVVKVCIPGSKASCSEHGCAVGYRICNDCGTGYGECVKNESTG